jgi:hypothetical protein
VTSASITGTLGVELAETGRSGEPIRRPARPITPRTGADRITWQSTTGLNCSQLFYYCFLRLRVGALQHPTIPEVVAAHPEMKSFKMSRVPEAHVILLQELAAKADLVVLGQLGKPTST